MLGAAASSEDVLEWEEATAKFAAAVEVVGEYTLAQFGRQRPFEIEYHLVRSTEDEANDAPCTSQPAEYG